MSEDEKQQIRARALEDYRIAKDDLQHREVQLRQWAEGFTALAEALRSDSPERIAFAGDVAQLRPGDHAITLDPVVDQARIKQAVSRVALLRRRVSELEADLRKVGAWPQA